MSEESAVVPAATVAPPPEDPVPAVEAAEPPPSSQNGGGPPRRVRLTEQQLEAATKEELANSWREQDAFLDTLDVLAAAHEAESAGLREALERMKQQHAESQHREKVLVRRLASKEQEMQDYASQLAELRAAQVPSAAALRSALLDPAASLLVQKLRQELAATKTRLEETQNELSAWKFTPDSNTGKRLMAKCRLLYQENEELGRVISSGRLAKLEGELALQKSFSDEVKKSQSELDEFLQELDEDVEGMQGTIYFLQQQLKNAKESVATLTLENAALRQAGGAGQAGGGSPTKEVPEKSWGEEEEGGATSQEEESCPPAEEERGGEQEEEEPMETEEQPTEEQPAAEVAQAPPSPPAVSEPLPSPLSDEASSEPPEAKRPKGSPGASPAQESTD